MSAVDVKSLPAGLLSDVEQIVWPTIQTKLAPIVWGWYGNHKDDKITKIFGMFQVTVSSFGLVNYALNEIFGAQPSASPAAPVAPAAPSTAQSAPSTLVVPNGVSSTPTPVVKIAVLESDTPTIIPPPVTNVPVMDSATGSVTGAVTSVPAAPVAETIAQYLAGPPLRTAPPVPIGMGPGLPGEVPIYAYAALLASIGVTPDLLNHLPLGTPIRSLIEPVGPYAKTAIDTAFGNTGTTVPSTTDPREFTVVPLDIADRFYDSDVTAYGWASVLSAS